MTPATYAPRTKRNRVIDLSLPYPSLEVAFSFYRAACHYPEATFEQITKRLVARGFGNTKASVAFKKAAKNMFSLAH
jgi:hypothetical protein